MQPNPISGFVFLCGILLIAIALFAWRRRTTNGAVEFALFMLLAAVYVLGYSLELASLNLATMLFWSKLQYIGVFFFPPLFLVFILRYTGQDRWITRRNLILLLALPALLMAAKLADGQLHWIYRTVAVDNSGPIPLLAITRGPLYVVSAVYNLILVATGMLLLWNKRRFSSALYRRQATLMTLSGLGPLLVYLVYILQFQPVSAWKHIDLNCFIFLVWGAGISWTMFRYRLFDLAPIARDALIEKLNDGLVVVDLQHRIVDTNPAAMRLFGWRRSPIGRVVEPRMAKWIDQVHGDVHHPPASIEAPFEQPGGESIYEVDIPALTDRQGSCIGYMILLHNITERKRVEAELHELSLTDELTGLNNRRGFTMLAAQYLQMAQRMKLPAVLCYIDLDDFKWINDTCGHPAGDQALIDAATLLKTTFRTADILARIGGDEFVVLTLETTEQSGERMLERLSQQLAAFNARSESPYPLALSMGMARYHPGGPASLEALLRAADRAMYTHKQARKSTLVPGG